MSTASQHPVDYLFERLADWTYPTGVVPVPQKKIPGTAFFPGGCGLWRERPGVDLPPMPLGKVMVLGQDFNNEKGYSKALQVGHELDIPTWRGSGRGRGLLGLLRDANISPTDCFFTNAYMGLRPAESSNKGPFPGRTGQGIRGTMPVVPAEADRCAATETPPGTRVGGREVHRTALASVGRVARRGQLGERGRRWSREASGAPR